ILGMLLADLAFLLWSGGLALPFFELGVQIALLVVLANLRLDIRIPISGHTLLFSYFLVRRVLVGSARNPIRHLELALASVLFLAAAYMKVFVWMDPLTLLFGTTAGAALAFVSWLLVRRPADQTLRRVA